MVTQARMDAFLVVEAVDVARQSCAELAFASEDTFMRELGLERMEEALHVCVVLAVARPVHAGHDAARAQEVLVAVG